MINPLGARTGFTVACLTFGILPALAFDTITERAENPEPVDFVIGLSGIAPVAEAVACFATGKGLF